MGVDNREWQNSQLQAATVALADSRRLSSGSAFTSIPSSLPAAGYSHLSSTAGIAAQAQAQPLRVPRRRGCQHCITCSGLQHHCHSTTVRSSHSPAAEWWPGGIHSPAVYYHLRAKQLSYADKFPQRSGASWRAVSEVHTEQSDLLTRRSQGPLAVLVPAQYTNVSQNESQIHYLGEKVVPLRRPATAQPQEQHQQPAPAVPTPPPKRGLEAPLRASRATWSHSCEPETILGTRRTSSSSSGGGAGFGFYSDPKRRCTEQKGQSETATPVHAGHFIARSTPSALPSATAHRPIPVFPGVVLQRYSANGPLPTANGTPLALLGVVTPPLGSMAPLSAASDVSASSVALMSEGGSDYGWSAHPSASMPTHAAAVWEMTSSSSGSSTASDPGMPVLLHNRSAPVSEDPTLQQYYARQYNIKQEQAFPCHQVIEMGVAAPVADTEHEDYSGWTSMLRSLAGSLKRTLSP